MDEAAEIMQRVSSESEKFLVEPRSVEETVQIVKRTCDGLDQGLGTLLVRPDAVLAIAGIKGMSDALHQPINDKALALRQIDNLNPQLNESGVVLSSNRRLDNPQLGLFIGRSTLGLKYKTSRLNILKEKYGLKEFDSSLGVSGVNQWLDALDDSLNTLVSEGVLTRDDAIIIDQGIALGYPDRAIMDFVDWYKTGRKKELVEADILSVHPSAKQFGGRITPEFDYYATSATDPEIIENIQNSRRILSGFYESPAIKDLLLKLEQR